MAESVLPGPICEHNKPREVNDGTSTRRTTCEAGQRGGWDLSVFDQRCKHVADAWNLATTRFFHGAVARHGGADFYDVIKESVTPMVVAVRSVIMTTLVGALFGGAMSSLIGGVGAAPGTIVGAKLGLMTGAWLLGWMGLSGLFRYMESQLGEVGVLLKNALHRAWTSKGAETEIDTAAREMAEAIGLFFAIFLQSLVLYLTKAASEGRPVEAMQKLQNSKLFRICEKLGPWLKENYPSLRVKFMPFDWVVLGHGPPIEGTSIPSWIRMRVGHRQFMIDRNHLKERAVNKMVAKGKSIVERETIGPATKHMAEDVLSRKGSAIPDHHQMASIRTATDFPMSVLAAALDYAEAKLVFEPRRQHFLDSPDMDGWKLGIDTSTKVWRVYHVTIPTGASKGRRWRTHADNKVRPWHRT